MSIVRSRHQCELHGAAVEKTAPSAHSELDAILNLEVTIAFGQRAADNEVRNETLTLRRTHH